MRHSDRNNECVCVCVKEIGKCENTGREKMQGQDSNCKEG